MNMLAAIKDTKLPSGMSAAESFSVEVSINTFDVKHASEEREKDKDWC